MEFKMRRFEAVDGINTKNPKLCEKLEITDHLGNMIDCNEIQTDENGYEYIYIHNPYSKRGTFSDCIKDAITCIREGRGDVLCQITVFSFPIDYVRKYIDREYGESLRARSIEGWKNANFGYAVKFTKSNPYTAGSLISVNKERMSIFDDRSNILTFDTKEDAEKFITDVYKLIENTQEEIIALGLKDFEEILHFFNDNVEGGYDSIYFDIFESTYKNNNVIDKSALKAVQILLS